MYAEGLPPEVHIAAPLTKDGRLPFVFMAGGTETHFTNGFDPEPRARRIFYFPEPATLAGMLRRRDDEHPTWRGKVGTLPPLDGKVRLFLP
jgi:type I restriction enzyme R subunit